MANIFISFFNAISDSDNPNAMPCFYESFIKGLEDEGNKILAYHHKFFLGDPKKITYSLLKKIKNFEPDLIILFNNNFYDISNEFECPIVIYEVDSILYYANKHIIKEKPNRFKYFIPQTESINQLKDSFGIHPENILYIPFFTSIQAESKEKTQSISFIGSRFTTETSIPNWSHFKNNKLNSEELVLFRNLLKEIEHNPFVSKQVLIQKFPTMPKNIFNHLDIDNLIGHLSDSKRVQILSEIADLGLAIYGTPSWNHLPLNPEVALSYIHKKVYSLKHNQDIYNSSKLCINVNHIQAKTGFSWRVCDIMASDSCLVSEYSPDFKTLFSEIKIPTFTNKFEARELCAKLLKENNLRMDIVTKCQEIINDKYRFINLCEIIQSFLGINLVNGQPFIKNNKQYLEVFSTFLDEEKQIEPVILKRNKPKLLWHIKIVYYICLLISYKLLFFTKRTKQAKILRKIEKYIQYILD